jgi:dihydrofolate reductase
VPVHEIHQEDTMRELTADMFVTLDGFASDADGGQNWISGYAGPEFGGFIRSVLDEPQLMIMGRVTYQVLSRYWPTATDEAAHRMNSLPKLVFSTTLREPLAWNNTRLAPGDLASEITALKRQPGDPIRSIGSIKFLRNMVNLGLVDRLRLMVFPAILGIAGQQPVFDGYDQTSLTLTGTTVLDSNAIVLEYRPAEKTQTTEQPGSGKAG